jgi:hypothetical protein
LRSSAGPSVRRHAHDAGFVHLDHQCFHVPSLQLGTAD